MCIVIVGDVSFLVSAVQCSPEIVWGVGRLLILVQAGIVSGSLGLNMDLSLIWESGNSYTCHARYTC